MRQPFSLKLLSFLNGQRFLLFFLMLLTCPLLWAAQEAVVTVDRALIFADKQMTAPVGFVSRGKRLRIGEIPRNKAQVYPIVVSGKLAYIKVSDVSTQREVLDSNNLVAERFKKQTKEDIITSSFGVAYLNYASQASIEKTNDTLRDKDQVNWTGVSMRGKGTVNHKWDVGVLANYYSTAAGREEFKVLETGIGAGFRFLKWGRLTASFEGQLLAIPFTSYAIGSDFRVIGRGFTTGAGVNLSLGLTRHWGLEIFGGAYYTRLLGLNTPKPYISPKPIFYGNRLGAGLYYAF